MLHAYVRVSTQCQSLETQKLAILNYTNSNNLVVENWIDVKVSSKKSTAERRVDELISLVAQGDTILVSELSRLARSVGQIAIIIDLLIQKKVNLISIKEDIKINGIQNMQSKVMTTMFSLLAEIEKDLISERTKEGIEHARQQGKSLGRPKGIGKSSLDGKKEEITDYLNKGLNITNIARIYSISPPALKHFIETRNLKGLEK